ncbi:MAG TPA: flagellin [Acidimicrobiales bacterium]|nr:flagellin [Acidimicrobiales bacterium]
MTQASAGLQMVNDLQLDLLNLTNLQEEAASGKSLNQPSDNPAGTSQVLSLNSQIGSFQQYSTNAGDGISWLSTATSALSSVTTSLDQVQSDVLSGANASASDADSLQALSTNVGAIKQTLLGLAATTYNNRYVFSGTYGIEPYPQGEASGVSDPTSASYNPAVAYAYAGSSTPVTRVIGPGQTVNVSTTGAQVFGSGSSSIFALLDTISTDLANGNTSALSGSDLTQLQAAMNQVTQATGELGAVTDTVEQAQTAANNQVTALQDQVGNISDASEDQVATELDLAQTSYQAALETTAHIIQPSLAEFLQ